jgi:hypothetical protein
LFRFRNPVEDPAAVFAEVDLAPLPDFIQYLGPDAHVAHGAEITLDGGEGGAVFPAISGKMAFGYGIS